MQSRAWTFQAFTSGVSASRLLSSHSVAETVQEGSPTVDGPHASIERRSPARSALTLGDRIGLWGAIGTWAGVLVGIAALTLGVLAAVGVLGGSETFANALGNGSVINRGTIIYNGGPNVTQPTSTALNCPLSSFPAPSSANQVFITMDAKASAVPTTSTCWKTVISAKPGDTIRYLITYENGSTTLQKNVVIRVNLAPRMTLIPNSTYIADESNPNSILYYSNNIATGGIVIGNYDSGANAYVVFAVTIPFPSNLACGRSEFTSVGVARPATLDEYDNSAIINVTKAC